MADVPGRRAADARTKGSTANRLLVPHRVWRRSAILRRAWHCGVLVFAGWMAILLGGCLAVQAPAPGAPLQAAEGKALVLGRVRVLDRGHEITPWTRELAEILAEDPVIRLSLFHVDSERRRPDLPISPDGRFEWILPAGTYILYHSPSIEPPFNEPVAAFQVAGAADPIDLGELRLQISVDRPLSWRRATYTLSYVEASAGSAETTAPFLQLHPGTSSVRHGSFVVDAELGGLFTNWSREAFARILRRHGLSMDLPKDG